MFSKKQRKNKRLRRKRRIRQKVVGTPERPRLTVYRSNRHIYCQVIDDYAGETRVAASSRESELAETLSDLDKTAQAHKIGEILADRAQDAGITRVVFDRNGYIYHGRVAALADGAREGGLDL